MIAVDSTFACAIIGQGGVISPVLHATEAHGGSDRHEAPKGDLRRSGRAGVYLVTAFYTDRSAVGAKQYLRNFSGDNLGHRDGTGHAFRN